MTTLLRHEGDEILLGFASAVRAAGVPVTSDRVLGFLEATAVLGLGDQRATYWAGRATLCGGPEDLERYDQVFDAWFLDGALPRREQDRPPLTVQMADLGDDGGSSGDGGDGDPLRAMASEAEVLRHRDVASMSAPEKAQLEALFARLAPRAPRRRARRRTPSRRGDVDAARTLRATLRRMGEPAEVAWRRRGSSTRRVVFLIDVSGSMSTYADSLLRLAHRFTQVLGVGGGRVEVFTVGTRLTRVTTALRLHDPARALAAAGESVPDWSGGTRLGEVLRVFTDRWGQRGVARGAVVVVVSDGWERGDAVLLGEQVRRLRRIAHRLVWVNPHRGKAGYTPVQGGILAVLPHVDDFVAGHSLAAFSELCEVVGRA